MSNFRILIFFLISNLTYSQEGDINEKIFWNVIDYKTESESPIGYVKTIPKNLMKNEIRYFNKSKRKVFTSKSENGKINTIKLNRKERCYISKELKSIYESEWNLKEKHNLIDVLSNESEIRDFLKSDKQNELFIISKPILIRNNSLCVIYYANLCCGKILGHTELSFLKLSDGKWKTWIPIFQGDF